MTDPIYLLDETTLPISPLVLLQDWLDDAERAGNAEASAMVLATADRGGRPSARTVLITSLHPGGLQFHTSRPTTKTADLDSNPRATGVFRWPELGRQVVVSGDVSELPEDVTEAVFATRPLQLRLIAWLYETSTGTLTRAALQQRYFELVRQFADGPIPRPESWTGYLLAPHTVDVWRRGSADPEHADPNERVRYHRLDAGWQLTRMLP